MLILFRNDNGTVPAYSFPGGYPVLYLCSDGESLCAACVNDSTNPVTIDDTEPDDPEWNVIGQYGHFEGDPIECASCGDATESAYGPVVEPRSIVVGP